MQTTRTTRLAVGVTALALITACGGDDDEAEADEPAVETTTPVASTTVADSETTTTDAPTTTATMPPVFAADAAELQGVFAPVDVGTHRVEGLGTPFSFIAERPLFVQPNSFRMFVLTDPGSLGPDDRDIVVMRATTLADPADPTASLESRDDGWPAADVAGWLDNLSSDIVVSNVEDTFVGGRPAIRADLELGDVDCPVGPPCLTLVSNHRFSSKELLLGSKYRVWFVEQGDEDPMVFIAAFDREVDAGWLDESVAIVSTVAFGEVGPNPIQAATAGVAELPLFGGIRVELVGDEVVVDAAIGRIAPDGVPGDSEFLTNPRTADDEPLTNIDDLVADMDARGAQVTELDPVVAGGFDARVFDIGGRPDLMLLKPAPGPGRGWFLPPRGRIWVIEHPDRGLLVLTAEAFDGDESTFDVVLAQTERIIESLEFIDLA